MHPTPHHSEIFPCDFSFGGPPTHGGCWRPFRLHKNQNLNPFLLAQWSLHIHPSLLGSSTCPPLLSLPCSNQCSGWVSSRFTPCPDLGWDPTAAPLSPDWNRRTIVIDWAFQFLHLPLQRVAENKFLFPPTTLISRPFLDFLFLRRELICFSTPATGKPKKLLNLTKWSARLT